MREKRIIEIRNLTRMFGSLKAVDNLSLAIEEDYTAKGRILRMHNKLTGIVELN